MLLSARALTPLALCLAAACSSGRAFHDPVELSSGAEIARQSSEATKRALDAAKPLVLYNTSAPGEAPSPDAGPDAADALTPDPLVAPAAPAVAPDEASDAGVIP